MCEFISWVEVKGKVKFLTYDQIYNTIRGKQLQKHNGNGDNLIGHGAIRWYYQLGKDGIDCECTDFSTPNNFPSEIVKAIKEGKFRGIGINVYLLTHSSQKAYDEALATAWKAYNEALAPTQKAYDEAIAPALKAYDEAIAPALKAYDEATAPAWRAYREATASAQKAYNEALASAQKAYDEAIAPALKAYDKAITTAQKAYDEAIAPALKAYDKAIATARKAYDEATQKIFWDLFAISEMRNPKWR